MSGRCHHCRAKTMALPGAGVRSSRSRPPTGWKLGWVVEKADAAYLVCYECVHRALLTAA